MAKKSKSRVNEAGNYTKPGMRKRLFESIKAGGKGGRPGQWSARKAQMLAKRYKEMKDISQRQITPTTHPQKLRQTRGPSARQPRKASNSPSTRKKLSDKRLRTPSKNVELHRRHHEQKVQANEERLRCGT